MTRPRKKIEKQQRIRDAMFKYLSEIRRGSEIGAYFFESSFTTIHISPSIRT